MDGIGKPASISSKDTRNKYIKALRYTPKGTVIDAVQPIRPAENQLYGQRPALLFNVDVLNRHLEAWAEAYRRLQEQNRRYGDLMDRYLENPEDFLATFRELIKQFNQTTASVLTFDRVYHTRHSEALADMLGRQQFTLEQAGMHLVGINQLELDSYGFRRAARENAAFFSNVFAPSLALFEHAFGYISRITPPPERHTPRR